MSRWAPDLLLPSGTPLPSSRVPTPSQERSPHFQRVQYTPWAEQSFQISYKNDDVTLTSVGGPPRLRQFVAQSVGLRPIGDLHCHRQQHQRQRRRPDWQRRVLRRVELTRCRNDPERHRNQRDIDVYHLDIDGRNPCDQCRLHRHREFSGSTSSIFTQTVNQAPLTITASNQTKVYGAALPTLTASYSGFVNGDTSASLTTQPTLTTTATASSHVSGNPYTITRQRGGGFQLLDHICRGDPHRHHRAAYDHRRTTRPRSTARRCRP